MGYAQYEFKIANLDKVLRDPASWEHSVGFICPYEIKTSNTQAVVVFRREERMWDITLITPLPEKECREQLSEIMAIVRQFRAARFPYEVNAVSLEEGAVEPNLFLARGAHHVCARKNGSTNGVDIKAEIVRIAFHGFYGIVPGRLNAALATDPTEAASASALMDEKPNGSERVAQESQLYDDDEAESGDDSRTVYGEGFQAQAVTGSRRSASRSSRKRKAAEWNLGDDLEDGNYGSRSLSEGDYSGTESEYWTETEAEQYDSTSSDEESQASGTEDHEEGAAGKNTTSAANGSTGVPNNGGKIWRGEESGFVSAAQYR
ncbi:hypothetical protein LTR56_000629 [Elasticomyces elasticus]|nr:hypothetical protein LTR56_000629 [Elasticomyces elasticus]KAK3664406.1 hypothetical protein LTR22_004819 [Elasticomyces elasticus]KAK4919408.1 hypothetical protein LTR49_012942 [Elasticomyces elasticus]KAK5758282.1 hypothetical protein LTS12_011605 [Elasticomyces elasticus]